MIHGLDPKLINIYPECLKVKLIKPYTEQLKFYLKWYLGKIKCEPNLSDSDVEKAQEKIHIFIRENNPITEYSEILSKTENKKTIKIIKRYTKCIMKLLGEIAECIIVDRCNSDLNFNIKCINIALLESEIYKKHSSINYDDYVAFSPSHKITIVRKNKKTVYSVAPYYNPNHTSKDIAWFKRDSPFEQLILNKPKFKFSAKLQIKTTLNSNNLDLSGLKYIATPIICFDLCNDIEKLKQKYPDHIIYSMRDIDIKLVEEIETYFYILSAYISGLKDDIDITELDLYKDDVLRELFNTPINKIVKTEEKKIDNLLDGLRSKVEKGEYQILI